MIQQQVVWLTGRDVIYDNGVCKKVLGIEGNPNSQAELPGFP